MGKITDSILRETRAYLFDEQLPNRYAFIMREMTKFPTPQEKWDVIAFIEKIRKNPSKLPTETINPQMLVKVQDSGNDKLFAVKFHGIYYLVSGSYAEYVANINPSKFISIKVLDLDTVNIGLDRTTSYN